MLHPGRRVALVSTVEFLGSSTRWGGAAGAVVGNCSSTAGAFGHLARGSRQGGECDRHLNERRKVPCGGARAFRIASVTEIVAPGCPSAVDRTAPRYGGGAGVVSPGPGLPIHPLHPGPLWYAALKIAVTAWMFHVERCQRCAQPVSKRNTGAMFHVKHPTPPACARGGAHRESLSTLEPQVRLHTLRRSAREMRASRPAAVRSWPKNSCIRGSHPCTRRSSSEERAYRDLCAPPQFAERAFARRCAEHSLQRRGIPARAGRAASNERIETCVPRRSSPSVPSCVAVRNIHFKVVASLPWPVE